LDLRRPCAGRIDAVLLVEAGSDRLIEAAMLGLGLANWSGSSPCPGSGRWRSGRELDQHRACGSAREPPRQRGGTGDIASWSWQASQSFQGQNAIAVPRRTGRQLIWPAEAPASGPSADSGGPRRAASRSGRAVLHQLLAALGIGVQGVAAGTGMLRSCVSSRSALCPPGVRISYSLSMSSELGGNWRDAHAAQVGAKLHHDRVSTDPPWMPCLSSESGNRPGGRQRHRCCRSPRTCRSARGSSRRRYRRSAGWPPWR